MKNILAAVSLAAAILLASVNMFLPPVGEVDSSVLNIFAQLLIFAATLLGVDAVIINRIRKNK